MNDHSVARKHQERFQIPFSRPGRRAAKTMPAASPGRVKRSGSSRVSASMTAKPSRRKQSTAQPAAGTGENRKQQITKRAQVADSMSGYCHEIRLPQLRQAPPNSSQLKTGMLSRFAMGRRQSRQCDRGATIDSPAGKRRMQTLRKLPSSKPLTAKKMTSIEDHSSTAIVVAVNRLKWCYEY
jgi:hypothetical protein